MKSYVEKDSGMEESKEIRSGGRDDKGVSLTSGLSEYNVFSGESLAASGMDAKGPNQKPMGIAKSKYGAFRFR